jgi:hypothetical protein
MNFEQILIRMGVDAKGVVTGLNKTSSLIKGWSAGLVNDMKSGIGRMAVGFFGFQAAMGFMSKIKNQILEIKNLQTETGASSNFIQSAMMKASVLGVSFNNIASGLKKFNTLLGNAKLGMPDAAIKLKDLGVISKKNEISTLSYSDALGKLADKIKNTADVQKRAALLEKAGFGTDAATMDIFGKGSAGIRQMEKSNFFTKISGAAIGDFSNIVTGIKTAGLVASATLVNALSKYSVIGVVRNLSRAAGILSTGQLPTPAKMKELQKSLDESAQKLTAQKALQKAADEEGITVQEKKAQIINAQNELLWKQKELVAEMADRNKVTIQQMAERTRRLTGQIDPTKLNYTISARDREALRIDTLEKKAQVAFERGDDKTHRSLTAEALQARKAFIGGTLKDREPMAKTEIELAKVNLQLEPVKRMAELVNEEHKQPK